MATTRQPHAEDGSLGRDLLYALRYYLDGGRSFLILAALALVGGLAFNGSWLAAAGIVPLLLTALPCAARPIGHGATRLACGPVRGSRESLT